MKFVKNVPLTKLKLCKENPRLHDEEQIARLIRSIEIFGWTNPVLVQQKTDRVIAGHGRIMAAHKMGHTTVPVLYLNLDETRAKGYMVADNQLALLSSWEETYLKKICRDLRDELPDLDNLGFHDKEMEKLLQEAEAELEEAAGSGERDPVYGIYVTCASEREQQQLERTLTEGGYSCRLLIS